MSSLETSPQKGEIGAALAQFAGSLDHISAREMTQAFGAILLRTTQMSTATDTIYLVE